MIIDPTTMWLYRGLLGTFILLGLVGVALLLARLGTGARLGALGSLRDLLAQKKTILLVAAVTILQAVKDAGVIDPGLVLKLQTYLGLVALITAKLGMNRTEQQQEAILAGLQSPAPTAPIVAPAILTPTPPMWPNAGGGTTGGWPPQPGQP